MKEKGERERWWGEGQRNTSTKGNNGNEQILSIITLNVNGSNAPIKRQGS